ncbi:MAG: hypothetical protein NVS9B15_06820 [Acidobacteriaceae bacterium]
MYRVLGALLLTSTLFSQSPTAPGTPDWSFAASGDSRNCGDVVMPAIAEAVHKDQSLLYWHLGDFRLGAPTDQDMEAAGGAHVWNYYSREWPDFIDNQLKPFAPTPVFLTIGNHELVRPKYRTDYVKTFSPWINRNQIRKQRLADARSDTRPHTYYHWRTINVDFISLDNASHDQFSPEQVAWFERTLALAAKEDAVKAIIVGMHAALPDSLASGHSMNDWEIGITSGRKVYLDLVNFHNDTKKPVYILASHSHFLMEGIFHTPEMRQNKTELPGWIVGTAGAHRYKLPAEAALAPQAKTNIYGYLTGTVHDDGKIDFKFHEVKQSDVPDAVKSKYGDSAVKECFDKNRD